jgi:hypothetical protein
MAGVAAAGLAVVTVGALVLTTRGDDEPASTVAAVATTVATVPPTTVPATVAPTEAPTTTTTEPDPGSLPQTEDRPSASSPAFQEHMRALWQAIVADDPAVAMPAFFPLGAYLQVKEFANPESDYRSRLIAAYEEDIHALHDELGAQASGATLEGVDVPDAQAVWVPPGAEYNKDSYWRVYGTTLRYTTPDGRSGAFPIASLISWRGEWYVVHLSSIR